MSILTQASDLLPQGGPATAAIFDFDGVLVDSESRWLRTIEQFLTQHGNDAGGAERFRGVTLEQAIELICTDRDDLKLRQHELLQELDENYRREIAGITAPIVAAANFVARLRPWLPLVVASNGSRRDVQLMLAATGLADAFQGVFTIDDVPAGKPAPDLYLAARQSVDSRGAQTLAFDDSPVGVAAAKAAGCVVVGVNADPRIALDSDLRIGSFAELEFDSELRRIRSSGR
ncbi:HAD family hydrolase [Gulosibacter chungangensis]|uniref:HAD family phosphatase n=1 Tax=Gulosibacter chungangensis TaxID=979746 RepID=A0A7J5B8U2_9MICO|nr:HAD family phosphatase [Gulosibacter chungangensis]KAB1641698.1 HAD family phosphatase [Gulosibacter chungangensis]